MKDPTVTNLSCQDAANNTTFTGSDDVWGNGTATNRETGCVDALFAAQTEHKMLVAVAGPQRRRTAAAATGRSGSASTTRTPTTTAPRSRSATTPPASGSARWTWSAHEIGHGIDDHTPGGISGGGTQEFVADTFGAATEWFANEPSSYDAPDFTVGEKINLVGSGPIRYMYNPSLARRPELLLQQHPVDRGARRGRARATTGSTCWPRAPARPTGSRPARPATAAA